MSELPELIGVILVLGAVFVAAYLIRPYYRARRERRRRRGDDGPPGAGPDGP